MIFRACAEMNDMKFAATSPEDQLPPEMAAFFMAGALPRRNGGFMQFFTSAIDTLQTLVVALGAGLGVWGVVNLLEGYGSDNPGSKSQGMKQFMAN